MAEHFGERIPGTPRYKRDKNIPSGTEPFFPNFLLKEWIVGSMFLVGFFLWIIFNPVELGPVANPNDTTFIPVPDWYFLFLYEVLKFFPGKYVVFGTVVLPLIASLVFILVPWLDIKRTRNPYKRFIPTASMLLTVIFMIWLTWLANEQHKEELAASSGGGSPVTGGGSTAALVDPGDPGAKIFAQTCAACHGQGLQGQIGPPLLGIGKQYNAEQLYHIVEQGFAPNMPPKGGLPNDQEVREVTEWLAKQKQ
jgi:menaquinol-cytochrome c reductase cytochrome b/c subunit